MKKIISFVGLFAVLGVGIGDAHGVAMSAQVRRLLQEKQEKIEQLEKCEGKKQGWMIAGISTIGLTAVGVGVNIAQASKSNRLSDEIEMEKTTLQRHQNELNRIQNDIAAEQAKKAQQNGGGNGQSGGGGGSSVSTPAGGGKYDDYKLTCDTVRFTFDKVDDYSVVLASLNAECQRVMNKNMVNLTELVLGDSNASKVVFECSGYKESITCKSNGGIVLNGGIIGQPCAEGIKNIANSKFTGVWTRDDKGQYTCNAIANDNLPIPCVCKKTEGGNGVEPVTPVKPAKQETSLQKCLRERKGDRIGTACCYLSRSVATYEKGACVCVGKGKTFEIDKDGHGLCIDVQPDVVGPERVLNMPCVEDDLQHPAKTGVYVNNGELLCKGLQSVNVATYPCSCKITSCSDGFHVSNKNNGCEDNCPGNNQKWDKTTQKCYDVSCVLGANRIGASACKCMDGLKREELADGRVKCIDEFEEGPGRNIPFRPFE